MSEVLEQEYEKLVREVYIAPIRSVIVVDDDFPTLDGLLEAEAAISSGTPNVSEPSAEKPAEQDASKPLIEPRGIEQSKQTPAPVAGEAYVRPPFEGPKKDVNRVRELVAVCRNRDRPWLVDVHDGKEVDAKDELKIAPYLHHSDLMILDYHLMGVDQGGDKAIAIMRKLAANHHFNLVIVYTRGYEGSIQTVFGEIAIGLTHNKRTSLSDAKKEALDSLIGAWEDEEGDDVSERLRSCIDRNAYLEELATPTTNPGGSTIGRRILDLFKDCPPEIKKRTAPVGSEESQEKVRLDPKNMLQWAMAERHHRLKSEMSEADLGEVVSKFDEDVNWIRTNSLFVTVVNKKHEPHELEGMLLRALNAWGPVPHQLLMGKMRAQMDEKGVIAEAEVLTDKFVQAGWLLEMLDGKMDRDRAVRHSIDRHWEALGDKMRADIGSFASRLFDNLRLRGREEIFAKYGAKGIGADDEEVLTHLNHYYSTKPVDRSHLTTGHVFEVEASGSEKDPTYWVCLSPACDLVPGQKTGGWKGRLGDHMPFMAVSLTRVTAQLALERINENAFLFVQTGSGIEAFTFYPSADVTSMPAWEQMFAGNGGRFIAGTATVKVERTREENGSLKTHHSVAKVVCQLRYEYALNLLQRLGGSLSRIGLDFRKQSADTASVAASAFSPQASAIAEAQPLTAVGGNRAA
ncbi:MAG: response regulator receiver domain [Candidatus Pacebacteria bacterium]|nr:response regulator receiver domain [Candidatus Paceibacterota bacterium]